MISELKRRFGYKCSGIKLNYIGSYINTPLVELRLCEAVNHSFNVPLLLNYRNLCCEGSQRSLGFEKQDRELISHISEESHVLSQTVKKALQNIPVFDKPIKNIFLGIQDEMEERIQPDLFIMHVRPKEAMELMKQVMVITNTFPVIKPYPFLSVCGGILVNTIKNKQMSISFGCPESRKYAGVDDSDVIVGIPFKICEKLINYLK
ncbi:MAG: DUF169 domain-containing protein [Bacteroidales bacterium]|nr:DUF169 domain-containing protein [Bacteroidales bacterium]